MTTIEAAGRMRPPERRTFALTAGIEPEPFGFHAFCLELPGAYGDGATPYLAVADLKAALTALLEGYLADGQPIPWQEPGDSFCVTQRIVVRLEASP